MRAERNRNDVKVAVQASIAHEHDDGKARLKNALEVFRGSISQGMLGLDRRLARRALSAPVAGQ